MTGAGNDFIVLDNRFFHFTPDELAAFARRFCRRRASVGADGLLALASPRTEDFDFTMLYFNADGSRGTMCGNGARCLARYAVLAGIDGPDVRFEADAGSFRADVPEDENEPVKLYLPAHRAYRPGCRPSVFAEGAPESVDFIWTGTEHIVVFVPDASTAPVSDWGPLLRRDESISESGANIDFVEIVERGDQDAAVLRVRTYERGVEAETDACGTGAVASALAAGLSGKTEASTTRVVMNGGELTVAWDGPAGAPSNLTLEGAADVVYRGTLDLWPVIVPADRDA